MWLWAIWSSGLLSGTRQVCRRSTHTTRRRFVIETSLPHCSQSQKQSSCEASRPAPLLEWKRNPTAVNTYACAVYARMYTAEHSTRAAGPIPGASAQAGINRRSSNGARGLRFKALPSLEMVQSLPARGTSISISLACLARWLREPSRRRGIHACRVAGRQKGSRLRTIDSILSDRLRRLCFYTQDRTHRQNKDFGFEQLLLKRL